MPLASHSLRDEIKPGGLPEQQALEIFIAVLQAVSYAHDEGVLHRDLKPENILFVDGEAIVADFGLSRRLYSESTTLTVTGIGMGTIAYGAPEQFVDIHKVDARADVYALGKILFEMLTGFLPFPHVNASQAPAKFRYMINRCIDTDPAARYASLAELHSDLELLLSPTEVFDPPVARAQELSQDALSGDEAALLELDKLLNESHDDELLYTKFVPYMQRPLIENYIELRPTGFRSMVLQFDEYATGRHPFSYTDVIANFFKHVFDLSEDDAIRRVALQRTLVVGYDHNRFHVGNVFAGMVKKCTNPSDIMMAADVLKQNPGAAKFAWQWLKEYSLPKQIKESVPSIAVA